MDLNKTHSVTVAVRFLDFKCVRKILMANHVSHRTGYGGWGGSLVPIRLTAKDAWLINAFVVHDPEAYTGMNRIGTPLVPSGFEVDGDGH